MMSDVEIPRFLLVGESTPADLESVRRRLQSEDVLFPRKRPAIDADMVTRALIAYEDALHGKPPTTPNRYLAMRAALTAAKVST